MDDKKKLTSKEFLAIARDFLIGPNEIRALACLGQIKSKAEVSSRYKKSVGELHHLITITPVEAIRPCFSSLFTDEEIFSKSYWGITLLKVMLIIYLDSKPQEELPPLDRELRVLLSTRKEIPKDSPLEKLVFMYLASCVSPPDQQEETIQEYLHSQGETGAELLLELPTLLYHYDGKRLLNFLLQQLEKDKKVLSRLPSALLCNLEGLAGHIARSITKEHRNAYAEELLEIAQREEIILPGNLDEDISIFLSKIGEDPNSWINLFRGYLANKQNQQGKEIIPFLLHITLEDLCEKLTVEQRDPQEIGEEVVKTFCRILEKEREEIEKKAKTLLSMTALEQPPEDPETPPPPPPEEPEEEEPTSPPPLEVLPKPPAPPPEPEQKTCSECQAVNPPGANFCVRCGSNLMKESPVPPEPEQEDEDEEAIQLARSFYSKPA